MPIEMKYSKGDLKLISYVGEVEYGLLMQEHEAMKKITKIVVNAAKEKAPVDTGELKKHIKGTAKKPNAKNAYTHAIVGVKKKIPNQERDVIYGHFVEFGTAKMNAQPYLKPGALSCIDEIKQIIAEQLPHIKHAENIDILKDVDVD